MNRAWAIMAVGALGFALAAYHYVGEPGSGDGVTTASGPRTGPVVGCKQRVESAPLAAKRRRDTAIGPVAFYRLPAAYRAQANRRDDPPKGDPGAFGLPVKAVALVRAGARITLVVPREQRQWMRLNYTSPHGRGVHTVTLQACRKVKSPRAQRRECGPAPRRACRWRNTQFGGGFEIDFENAPHRALCAELSLRVKGQDRPLRKRLFRPERGQCSDNSQAD